MNLDRFGVDTVRVAHDLKIPVPMQDPGYRDVLASSGWTVSVRTEKDDALGLFESRTAFWQDEENPTIRAQVQNAGRTVVMEYSVPRVITESVLNTRLASIDEALDVTALLKARMRQQLPEMGDVQDTRFRRLDMAGDVAAGEARPGLIAAAAQFVVPGARKITRNVFPGETGRVTTQAMTFRGYDKGKELENKTAKVLKDLDDMKREAVQAEMKRQKVAGMVRLELALTPKKSTLTEAEVKAANIKWADVVQTGFSGGVLYIGGLEKIRRELDSRKAVYATESMMAKGEEKSFRWKVDGEFSVQRRNMLLSFAVRYAELGEDGMLAEMSRATFYRQRKMFLEAGLCLDDISTYTGEIDLRPIIEQVRAG